MIPQMGMVDNAFETALGLAWIGMVVNIGLAVLAWLYAAVAIGGSAVGTLVALVFIALGAAIVFGSFRLYSPTVNPIVGFRSLLTFHWTDEVRYHCGNCDRTFGYPGSLDDPECPYCSSTDLRTLDVS